MEKAFVDTTILVDILLKSGPRQRSAKEALKQFEYSELPVYAIRELWCGALHYYAWFHNVVVTSESVSHAVQRLQCLAMTPQRHRTGTGLEAFAEGMSRSPFRQMALAELVGKYGPTARLDELEKDFLRLDLKARIFQAWRKRREVTDAVVEELSCFPEVEPKENSHGLITISTKPCNSGCQLSRRLARFPVELKCIIDLLKGQQKSELVRRRKALKKLLKRAKRDLPQDDCRYYGDAVFAILAPSDSVLLTTNLRDYEPMARALNKEVVSPGKTTD